MFDDKKRFVIEDYNRKKPFSSFLPGIAGVRGIPLWSFYVNRGQGICSFGSHDKQNPIMEFFPAHTSYQLVKQRGFRTFLKVNGEYYEPFSSDGIPSNMAVGKNELEISEVNEKLGIKVKVTYYILPEERVGALVRRFSVTNLNDFPVNLECIDGIPALIPYGVTLRDMKEVTQLIQAWMQVEHVEDYLPFYRLLASSADTAEVSEIRAVNFYAAFDMKGQRLPVIVDPELLFQYDTQLKTPVTFLEKPLQELLKEEQVVSNQLPSGFGCMEACLAPGNSCQINSLTGHVQQYEVLPQFVNRGMDASYFEEKEKRAVEIVDELAEQIHTETASQVFDEYCKQTYIDNLLRGGYPIRLAEGKPFYVYSRKHGDLERDYNSFSMLAEFYSQGNGNYRDVSQNRRSDLIFSPFVKDYNIKRFYNLIQLDGYNPLVLLQSNYSIDEYPEEIKELPEERRKELEAFLSKPFTPGQLAVFLTEEENTLFEKVIQNSKENAEAVLDDGYWTDHWTYNLDLVESYISVYPEEAEQLLFDDRTYTYYETQAIVLPRKDRYVPTESGLRQFHSIDRTAKEHAEHIWARASYGKGETYKSSLVEKMLLLAVMKFAALDIHGKGIEMEAGKPGWYDALNGLPALFGSSMCESYELKRQMLFLIEHVKQYDRSLQIPVELKNLIDSLNNTVKSYFAGEFSKKDVWNRSNIAKEQYRELTKYGIAGEEAVLTANDILQILGNWIAYMDEGIKEALEKNDGIPPAYCAYSMNGFEEKDGFIEFHGLKEIKIPDFLEGPVRYLKLPNTAEKKTELYHKVKESELYDNGLKMYKVNASLENASYEIGRARAFNRGWLENESIWIHMEYKYLLELLKSGLYKEFFEDMKTACIPFLDYETYGRSLTENSSFIASSVHPNKKIHGRGYVARLSGSTAEFLQMWQIMFFGNSFIKTDENGSRCSFLPAVPDYLIPENGTIKARLFGGTDIVYHVPWKGNVIPGEYDVLSYCLKYKDGMQKTVKELGQQETIDLRNEKLAEVLIQLGSFDTTTKKKG